MFLFLVIVLFFYVMLHPILFLKWLITLPLKEKKKIQYREAYEHFYGNYYEYAVSPKESTIVLCKKYLDDIGEQYKMIVEIPLSNYETRANITFKVY